ncbi:GAF domain-containing sensor histidine kinase [Pseudomonas sp. MM211]|uniref:GAF domain-containing sensor histidine kinase n=1 Tax=Pseudomonas sp. MM211 TaxID=2866808 RepID=UPI001CEDC4D7|nr:GAF domain-containing sensor histidine kinase [Pseudomonas sp. MM211]UCJ18286.1 GAF domain-containing sensor histidine kinase [Pseudomonas sp. MM211]
MSTINFGPDLRAVAKIEAIPMILRMVKHVTGLRFAAVARVTDKQWVTCAVDDSIDFGLKPGDELALETTICDEIRQHRTPVLFGHASEHPIFSRHHTPKFYGLESYVSIPIIRANGDFFGTLCAIDPAPANLDIDVITETLTLFAQLIAANLDMQASVEQSQRELEVEKETGHLREQLIAVLGHDLRTPLSAVRMGADILESKLVDRPERRLATAIQSSAKRMGSLIENILDFARGRLGSGIPVEPKMVANLQTDFERVISEITEAYPAAVIEHSVNVPQANLCDPVRLCQLLSNLLANAVTHGRHGTPIKVNVGVEDGHLVLCVWNEGVPIDPELMPKLFQPYTRSELGQREGLGLGLYIAAEIIRGHNGTVCVVSNETDGTSFTARLPTLAAGD